MTTLKAKKVNCYELTAGECSLGLYKIGETWNGLTELESIEQDPGQKLITSTTEDYSHWMTDILSTLTATIEEREVQVIAGSPDIIARIKSASGATHA